MTKLEKYIKEYFDVDDQSLNQVTALFQKESLGKGDFFVKSGQRCKKLSFIREGFIRIYLFTENRGEVTQWISGKGSFTTDLSSLIFDKPAKWNIQALTHCELYSISKENYRRIGKTVPEWDYLEKQFIAKCFTTIEDRVFSLLSMSAEERYRALLQSNKALFNQVPLQYLASMLGMTPETLSRLRRKAIS